ncbi:V-type ATP synthase subunit A [Salinispira pacifica]
MSQQVGALTWISEFIVKARLDGELTMSEQVLVGNDRLTAEVIGLDPGSATVQVYEDTSGLRAGAPLYRTGRPLSAALGPGLLGNVFDGIQRPLRVLKDRSGLFVQRGVAADPLDTDREWHFEPRAQQGNDVTAGEILGAVQETPLIEHRIMVPPDVAGKLVDIAGEGDYHVTDRIATVEDKEGKEHAVTMVQHWHVRRPRPSRERLQPTEPLVTGQRVVDTLFPIAKGGSAAVPGGFGAGKTVLQHSLAQWSDADVIVYIGCGERGNEMVEVLEEFPEIEDPWSGHPLMERTVLIANTSNMPVAARESSIYTGVTIAEYYRDQGYDVALMADSTSRWAQALREIAGRLGEMPIEEGYPAYLPARLSAFYERAGLVRTYGGGRGSVTLIGAVSPPGGDFSEPVTRNTQRFTRCWWALDSDLANRRHFPSIGWLTSYSLQVDQIAPWWKEKSEEDWMELRSRAMRLLQQESELQQLVQLVGPDALSDEQQWVLTGARLLREGFLQQNALNPTDAYAVPEKQLALLSSFLKIYRRGTELLKQEVALSDIRGTFQIRDLLRLKDEVPNEEIERIEETAGQVLDEMNSLDNGEQSE